MPFWKITWSVYCNERKGATGKVGPFLRGQYPAHLPFVHIASSLITSQGERGIMYLGYYGERIQNTSAKASEYDWFTSKFGGSISALQEAIASSLQNENDGEPSTLSHCDCCKGKLSLIAQIHAPQSLCPTQQPPTGLAAIAANSVLSPNYKPPQGEDDEELRVLIILACNEKRCWKLGRATWKAYRFQPRVVVSEEALAKIKEEKAAAFRKTLQTPTYKDDDDKPAAKKTPTVTPTKNLFAMPTWSSPFGGSSFGSPASPSTAPSASQTSDQDLEALLKKRDESLSPQLKSQKNTASTSSPSPSPKPNSGDASPSQTSSLTSKTTPVSAASIPTQPEAQDATFAEAYMEFDKEPEVVSYSGYYNEYEKKANENLSEGAEGTWAGEGYESSVSAKDKPFHRFHKRLQRAPEQCLRYWRGAEPLFSSSNPPKTIPLCACGSKRVPETQLTPALIYMLKCANEKHESNLDFGTVIIYTCAANCTTDRKPLHSEHVEIQKGA